MCSLCSVAVGCSRSLSRHRIHVLVVRLTVQLNVMPITCSHSTHCRTGIDIHSAHHHVVVLRFLLAWTCLPGPLHLPSKKSFAAVQRNLLPLFSSVCNEMIASTSMGLYLIGGVAPAPISLFLPVHVVRLILPDEQVVPDLNDVRC